MLSLITRSDDLGLNASTNLAICRAVDFGFVKNVSVLATSPCLGEAAAALKDRRDICFGLHADITSEWDLIKWGPVSDARDVPSLTTPEGHLRAFVEDIIENGVNIDEIIREYDAQLARLKAVGFSVAYVDGHMAPDWFIPGLSDRVAAWAKDRGLIYVNRLRNTLPDCMEMPNQPGLFEKTLAGLDDGVYLYVGHPAVYADEMKLLTNKRNPGDKAARQRERDYRFITSPDTLRAVKEHNVALLRYDQAYNAERT